MKVTQTTRWLAVILGSAGIVLAAGVEVARCQCTSEVLAKLWASDGGAGDRFGNAVAIDGDTAVVGARLDDDSGYKSGSAYVFVNSNGIWVQEAKLLPCDIAAEDNFGASVAIDGDTIVVASPNDDDNDSNSGSVYIFERGAGWGDGGTNQVAKLLARDGQAGDWLGRHSVAIDGDTVVAVAQYDDDNGSNSGSAYVFEKGTGWLDGWANQAAKLLPDDGAAGDVFGVSAAVSDDTVVIGAPYNDDDGTQSGSAYIFEKDTGWLDGHANQVAKLHPCDAEAWMYFAHFVDIDGDTIVIGTLQDTYRGSAYVFEKDAGWVDECTNQVAKLLASEREAHDNFGYGVTISGKTILVGANGKGEWSGAAYAFLAPTGGWATAPYPTYEDAKFIAYDGEPGEQFGVSVAISGTTAVSGAYKDNDNGSVYVFTGLSDCNSNGAPDACEAQTNRVLYWTEFFGGRVRRASLDGGGIEELVSSGVSLPRGLAVDSFAQRIFWGQQGGIRAADLDGSNPVALNGYFPGPDGMSLSPCDQTMYFVDGGSDDIWSYSYNGTDAVELQDLGYPTAHPDDIALDLVGGQMYWVDRQSPPYPTIYRSDLLPNAPREALVGGGLIGGAVGIALDLENGMMYWTEDNPVDYVRRAHIEIPLGETAQTRTDIEDLVVGVHVSPRDIVLDLAVGKMYWSDIDAGVIRRANLDGSNVEDVFTGLSGPWGLALVGVGDCNLNNIPDECEEACSDCNSNGISDQCELADADCDSDGRLDICQAAWHEELLTSAPSPRRNHAMADLPSNGVLLFGGYDGANFLNDTWRWDGQDWCHLDTLTVSPIGRGGLTCPRQ